MQLRFVFIVETLLNNTFKRIVQEPGDKSCCLAQWNLKMVGLFEILLSLGSLIVPLNVKIDTFRDKGFKKHYLLSIFAWLGIIFSQVKTPRPLIPVGNMSFRFYWATLYKYNGIFRSPCSCIKLSTIHKDLSLYFSLTFIKCLPAFGSPSFYVKFENLKITFCSREYFLSILSALNLFRGRWKLSEM